MCSGKTVDTFVDAGRYTKGEEYLNRHRQNWNGKAAHH